MGRWRVEHVGTDSSGVVRGRRPAPTHTSLRTAPFAKEGATAGVTTYNNDSKVVHGTDDQSSSSTATLEYFEYGGFESLNKIPVARLSDGVLLNLQLLFTFEWQFTIEKRLVPVGCNIRKNKDLGFHKARLVHQRSIAHVESR